MSQGNISIHQLYLRSPGSQDLLGFHTALPFHLSLQMTEEKDIKFDIMAPKENRKKMVVKWYQTLAALMRQRKAKSYPYLPPWISSLILKMSHLCPSGCNTLH